MKKILLFAFAGFCAATIATTNTAHAFGLPSLPGMGGKEEEKKTAVDVEGDIAGILQKISDAKSIETRGRKMIASAKIAMINAQSIVNSAEFAASTIKKGIDNLAIGADEVKDSTTDLYVKLAAVRAAQKDSVDKMIEVRDMASDNYREESDEMGEDGGLDMSGESLYESEYEDDQTKVNDAVAAFNSKHSALGPASVDAKAAFLTKIVFPTVSSLYGAKKAIEISIGNFPEIDKSLDNIDKEASEAGKEIVMEGVKTVAVLALQRGKIQNLITQLQANPIKNLDNINKLKDILSQVTFFMNTIKSHNAKIETVNGILANFMAVMQQSKPLLQVAARDASQVITAMESAVQKIMAAKAAHLKPNTLS